MKITAVNPAEIRNMYIANSCIESYRYTRLLFRCVRNIAKSDCWFRHVCPSVPVSTWNN